MTNQHIRPSFEEDEAYAGVYYSAVGASLIERVTVTPPGPSGGTAYGRFTSNRTANIQLNTPVPEAAGGAWFIPAAPTEIWSVGLDVIWMTGTPKDVRLDCGFGDASNVWVYQLGTTGNGGRVNPAPTANYFRLKNEGFTCPADKDRVRIRVSVLNAVPEDVVAFDLVQIEQGTVLPPYNEQPVSVVPVLLDRWVGAA